MTRQVHLHVVNRKAELRAEQTTTRLIERSLHEGHSVVVTDIFSLSVRSATELSATGVRFDSPLNRAEICEHLVQRPVVHVLVDDLSLIMLRTSPGRDLEHAWAHRLTLQFARMASERGVAVTNDPLGLERASSKLYAACLPPAITPRTLVTHDPGAAREFVGSLGGPAVLKPLVGSQGRDVFFVASEDEANLLPLAQILGRTGYLIVQEYLEEAGEGDVRVLMLDGEVLTMAGAEAAVRRVPPAGEFRSNVALGARARPVALSQRQRAIARQAGQVIIEDGIRLAGLDLVGERIIEINVYSTGGLLDAETFYNRDFAGAIVRALGTDS